MSLIIIRYLTSSHPDELVTWMIIETLVWVGRDLQKVTAPHLLCVVLWEVGMTLSCLFLPEVLLLKVYVVPSNPDVSGALTQYLA